MRKCYIIIKSYVNREIFAYSIDQANTIFAIKYYQKLRKARERIAIY